MASLKESLTIDKLNQNNYSVWKFKIEMLLMKEDLYDHIIEEPPDPMTNDWEKKDKKARALINLCIDDNQILYVKNEEFAKGSWLALKKVHERTNLSSKLYLLRRLYSTKLDEGGNMINHIIKILETTDKLKAIGENVNDSHLAALLLCSLPPSYDTLITALEARPESELNVEFIKGKLTDEYNKRVEASASLNENANRAFKTNIKKSFQKQNKFCTYCHKRNHEKSECWHLKNKLANNQRYQNRFNNKNKQNSSLCFELPKVAENGEAQSETNDPDPVRKIPTTDNNENSLVFLTDKINNPSWIIDSGSSRHVCNKKELFTEINDQKNEYVTIANGKTLKSFGSGTVKFKTKTKNGEINLITLQDVMYVPEIESNLLSVRKATQNGCDMTFQDKNCKLNYEGKTYIEGLLINNLYHVILEEPENKNYASYTHQCDNKNCVELWHRRLGHRNTSSIKEMITKNLVTGINIKNCTHNEKCECCILSKMTDAPYPKQAQHRANKIMDLVHSDVCGPFKIPSIGGKTYFLTFIDDYSRFTIIYLLSKKSEVAEKLKEYIAMTKNKFGKILKTLRSDNGGEYTSREIDGFLKQMGITHQMTVPRCASQNGVAERKNRTLIEMTRCLLREGNLHDKFWGEAVNTAVYLQNRLPTKATEVTPYELWTGYKPDLSHMKIFGSKAYAYIDKTQRGKLNNKAIEGIFVGYDNRSKGYRIYTGSNRLTISRAVKFLEKINSNNENKHKPDLDLEKTNDNTFQNQSPKAGENEPEIKINLEGINEGEDNKISTSEDPRRSSRTNKGVPPDRFSYFINTHTPIEPKSWEEMENIKNPDEKEKWKRATEDEMHSLKQNKTWELVIPPQGKKIIGCKWTFKAKYGSNGKIEKYKARLVAKGFSQKFGCDYDETFAPVVTFTTIRSFIASAAYKNHIIKHIDIKTAFLHGNLDEDVYMSQPEGYIKPGEENKVCKLNKAIYGLKQAARAWNVKIGETLSKIGFVQSTADPCLFKFSKKEKTVYVIVYVDDILISGSNSDVNNIIENLEKEFEIKDLGEVTYYLGINIKKNKEGNYELDQRNKINEIVQKFNLADAKPCDTPMEPGYMKLDDEEKLLPNNTNYRKAVGALLYIATVTRPDISAAVNILSRRNEKPREKDWNAVKRVIRYLKTTKNLKLTITKQEKPTLVVYADADWAGDTNDRKSTTGNLFKLGDTSILWITKKQNCVALSSAEAEYVSAANAAQETVWLINLLKDLDLHQQLPIMMYEDNQSCIKMTQSDKHHAKTKHIDIKIHSIKNLRETGIIDLEYCPSKEMKADTLTKPLPRPDFIRIRDQLGLLIPDTSEIKQGC